MRVGREELLRVLESASMGLASREILEQSTCLVFTQDGRVVSFNDEVSASRQSPLNGVAGAVKAKPLLELLSKLSEDELDVDQVGGELQVKGKRRKAGIRMEAEVMLPIETVDVPEVWRDLPTTFGEAVSIVHSCASAEESQFVLTCVHIHPEWMEACDKFQIARYPMETGVQESVLVRASSLKKILGLDMTEVSETGSWIHFRNPAGLVVSCRRYLDEYSQLDKFLSKEGTTPFSLPGGLEEALEKAQIFSAENISGNRVLVDMRSDRIVFEGQGSSGWYKEMKKITYTGEPLSFLIAPKLLLEVSKKSNECAVAAGRLFIDSGKFRYVTCTVLPEDSAPSVEDD